MLFPASPGKHAQELVPDVNDAVLRRRPGERHQDWVSVEVPRAVRTDVDPFRVLDPR